MVFLAPPEALLLPCKVHERSDFMEDGQTFNDKDTQLIVSSALAIANTAELGKCNKDKLDLRIWVNKQKEIFEKGKAK